ncbi:biopolymer transporter ExbD [Thalassotalea marina]|uniref:Biopolymer transporter ExbD n=1 Tax=Thalassotalea marina TaxID=1673741 RepID=A0A919BR20_9GAMM|nr:biopolymer transporter ExbD [Thalassotalea marina]GHG04756.1 hypothetical protein GCM10017161_37960 [Thalassotalea marina]
MPEFNEPNMTPLVDVMLVLIIILLLASPLLLSSVKMDVDTTKNQPTIEPSVAELVLLNDNEVIWQGTKIPTSSLKTQLQVIHQ